MAKRRRLRRIALWNAANKKAPKQEAVAPKAPKKRAPKKKAPAPVVEEVVEEVPEVQEAPPVEEVAAEDGWNPFSKLAE